LWEFNLSELDSIAGPLTVKEKTTLTVQLEEVARGDGQSPGLVAQLEEVRRVLRAVEPRDKGGVQGEQ
jgi:hypothetical protein